MAENGSKKLVYWMLSAMLALMLSISGFIMNEFVFKRLATTEQKQEQLRVKMAVSDAKLNMLLAIQGVSTEKIKQIEESAQREIQ